MLFQPGLSTTVALVHASFNKFVTNISCHWLYALPEAKRAAVLDLIKEFTKGICGLLAVLGRQKKQSNWVENWFRVSV